jgi:hypothetical protein
MQSRILLSELADLTLRQRILLLGKQLPSMIRVASSLRSELVFRILDRGCLKSMASSQERSAYVYRTFELRRHSHNLELPTQPLWGIKQLLNAHSLLSNTRHHKKRYRVQVDIARALGDRGS